MDRRTLVIFLALPLGFAGVFWLLGLRGEAVAFVCASLWVGRTVRLMTRRWGTRWPGAGIAWPARSYHVCAAAMPVCLAAWGMGLPVSTLSFLLGVSTFKLWVLCSLPLWSDRPWAYRLVGSGGAYAMVVLGALAVSVGVHSFLFSASQVDGLPLLGGFFLEFILLVTVSELMGD